MLTDYLFKMANDHPLLTYIEDPFAPGDIAGYQKIMNKFKETRMCISVKNWFGSDLVELQKHIALTIDQSESDEEADETKNDV
jgi:L-alanine-DL-glutamate epimerase-like enolase superfamily enzyme